MKRSTPCALFPVFSSAAITPRAWLAVVVGTFANCRPPLEGSCRIRSVNVPPTSQPTMTAPISNYLQRYFNEYSDAFLVPEWRRIPVSDQDKPGADSTGAGSVRLVIEVGRLALLYLLGLEVQAAGIDRRRASGRTGILKEDDLAAGLRLHFVFEMRIRHECKGARLVDCVAELEFTFQNVPDLGEVVFVERKACARFVLKDPGVRLGRPPGVWMKQEFSLVFEPTYFPFHVVYVPVFWSKMRGILSGHGYLPAGFYIQD